MKAKWVSIFNTAFDRSLSNDEVVAVQEYLDDKLGKWKPDELKQAIRNLAESDRFRAGEKPSFAHMAQAIKDLRAHELKNKKGGDYSAFIQRKKVELRNMAPEKRYDFICEQTNQFSDATAVEICEILDDYAITKLPGGAPRAKVKFFEQTVENMSNARKGKMIKEVQFYCTCDKCCSFKESMCSHPSSPIHGFVFKNIKRAWLVGCELGRKPDLVERLRRSREKLYKEEFDKEIKEKCVPVPDQPQFLQLPTEESK